MRATLLLVTIFVCATAGAQVYKRIGPDGQVYFSDQPGPDAEPVELSPPQIISMPPLPERKVSAPQGGGGVDRQQDAAAFSYTRFSVVSPAHDQGYRANDGNITVRLSLEPELRTGHSVVLSVDGEDGEQVRTGGMDIALSNLSRGRHTVSAQVVDEAGRVLIKTEPVGFYILRVAGGS